MQQQTTKELYSYWDHIRNRQIAPRRFQVEPAKIPQLLRETFIAECEHAHHVPFRLAGTQICHHFGRELRGTDLLELWTHEDRIALSSMIQNIIGDGAVVHGNFIAMTDTNREAIFEFVLLPLIHTGNDVNRILGAFTTIDQPFWLGAEPLIALELRDIGLIWPDGIPVFLQENRPDTGLEARQRFRVIDGGLSHTTLR